MAIPTKFVNDSHKVDYILMQLNDDSPKWAVPEMQRKFVWKDVQIIKFLSSMFLGYPVGSILYWEDATELSHLIGSKKKNNATERFDLIIDGQQRLTSLKVIFEGLPVWRRNKKPSHVRIQFNPLVQLDQDLARFEIINKKGGVKPGWIDVLEVLTTLDQKGKRERRTDIYNLVTSYIKRNPELSAQEKELATKTIPRLYDLYSFEIPAVRLLSATSHAEAADIFVRINSSGTKLDMADFIMTSLALNSQKIKDEIHDFAEKSPESLIFEIEPIDALTALIGFTFGLPAGSHAYDLLKGPDKESNLKKIEGNLSAVCNANRWSDFLDAVSGAGIYSKKYLSSEAALISSYSIYLYLIEKKDSSKEIKQNAVSLWILFCTFTKRYTSHTDSQTKRDLHEFIGLKTAEEIIQRIYKLIDEKLSSLDAYKIFSDQCSESMLTICCAQQDAKPLFSKTSKVGHAIRTSTKANKLEEHHIFPKNYMVKYYMNINRALTRDAAEELVDDKVDVTSNLAPIASSENSKIGDNAPIDYIELGSGNHQPIKEMFSKSEWDNMCEQYALPPDWWKMDFDEFISKRSELIPKVIKKSFDSLRTFRKP